MVPVNLTYLNCLQLSYIEHLFNLQFILEYVDNIIYLLYFPGVCLHILIGILVILHLNHRQIIELRQKKALVLVNLFIYYNERCNTPDAP